MKYFFFAMTLAGISILAVLFLVRIGEQSGHLSIQNKPHKISVVTSFYPLFFFASQIVGDEGTVTNITPAGSEPHDYEPNPQDIARIEQSDLLILNGIRLESWGNSIRESLKGSSQIVVVVAESLGQSAATKQNGADLTDPHIWLSPVFAKKEVEIIAQSVEHIDPPNSESYQKNAQILINQLDALDREYREGLRMCQKKDIITSHAAFGYLANEYGFNQVSISGLSPAEEPAPKKLAKLSDFAAEHGIHTIFFEPLVSPRTAETVAHEIGAQTLVLNPLEGLTDQEVANGKNYFTEMKKNLANLKIALQCQ